MPRVLIRHEVKGDAACKHHFDHAAKISKEAGVFLIESRPLHKFGFANGAIFAN